MLFPAYYMDLDCNMRHLSLATLASMLIMLPPPELSPSIITRYPGLMPSTPVILTLRYLTPSPPRGSTYHQLSCPSAWQQQMWDSPCRTSTPAKLQARRRSHAGGSRTVHTSSQRYWRTYVTPHCPRQLFQYTLRLPPTSCSLNVPQCHTLMITTQLHSPQ